VAESLYEDREVREQLATTIADGLEALVPDDVAVPRQELLDAGEAALDDPAVESLVRDGLVRSHQRFLGQDPNPDEPIVVDGAAMGSAARNALVAVRPELATVVPPPPSLPVTLPTDSLPDASGFRSWLVGVVTLGALAAVGLVAGAFVITDERHRVLRRVGWWGIGAGAAWVVIGYVLPELARLMLPGQAAIFAAIIGVMAGGMLTPSITAMGLGAAGVVLGFFWWAVSRMSDRSRARRGRAARRDAERAPEPPATYPRGAYPPGYQPPGYEPPPAGPPPAPPAGAAPDPTRVAGGDPTRVTPGPATPAHGTPRTNGPTPAEPPPLGRAPRWVEGVGYVDE
jgi:hypothetical protein